jgi:hypothetical protein
MVVPGLQATVKTAAGEKTTIKISNEHNVDEKVMQRRPTGEQSLKVISSFGLYTECARLMRNLYD